MEKETGKLVRYGKGEISRRTDKIVRRGLNQLQKHEFRIINFSSQFSIGTLYTVDSNNSGFWWDQKREEFCEAIGEVLVPSGKKLILVACERRDVNEDMVNHSDDSDDFFTDLSPLAKLNFDDLLGLDLSGISFRDLSIIESQARSNYLQHLTGLEWISMRENKVNDEDLTFLSKMNSLQYLDLSDTEVSGDALYRLKNSKLRELYLNTTNVSDVNGIGFLSHLLYLEKLDLGGNQVTYWCLGDFSLLTNLKELAIDFVHWENYELEDLADVLPSGCEIIQR